MPEETVITTPADKKDETPKEPTLVEEVREKSFQQILKEQAEERAKQREGVKDDAPAQETDEEKKKKEEEAQAAKDAAEAKQKVEEEDAARKRDEEIAKKAAEDVVAKQKEAEDEKAAKLKAEEEEKQRQENLKPKFTGKDKDGNPVPKDYSEITTESARIAAEEAAQRVRDELAAKEKVKQDEAEKIKQGQEQQAKQKQAFEDQLQKELDQDLTDLYTAGKLPKIKDPKDPNDIGNKEFANLFETAQKVNAERMAKGEAPIRSLKLIFYEHYKPLAKPAGHNAPVLGNESSLSNEAPEDKYIPSRDRNKSMAQLVAEEAKRLAKKLNVRGN